MIAGGFRRNPGGATMATYETVHPFAHEPPALPLAQRVAGGGAIWLVGRILLGGLFFVSGIEKLMGLDQFAATLMKGGLSEAAAAFLAPLGALVETMGGLAILVGFATGWASLVMAAFVVVATLVSHRFWEFEGALRQLQMAHFEKNVMLVGAFCLLYVAGGGPYSVDRWQRIVNVWRTRNQWRLLSR
jgi:putative oxidoreductase